LLPDKLINPRVVLLAESFPASVTATAVWLNERGIDLTLMRYQAYRTSPEHIILTVSQLYPVREVADFEVAPHTSAESAAATADKPEIPWTQDELASLADVANATTLAIVDLCALSPDTWINPPYEKQWAAGGTYEAYYRMDAHLAAAWRQIRGSGITAVKAQASDVVPVPGEDAPGTAEP
jgi:hypothetical protein